MSAMLVEVVANSFCPNNCPHCVISKQKLVRTLDYCSEERNVCENKDLCKYIYDMAFNNGYNSAYNETLDALLKEDQCSSKPEVADETV